MSAKNVLLFMALLVAACGEPGVDAGATGSTSTHSDGPTGTTSGASTAASGSASASAGTAPTGTDASASVGTSAASTSVDTSAGTGCVAHGCGDVGVACGPIDDGCGATIECGPCPEGQTCAGGQCSAPGCFPAEQATSDGGGRCADLAQAWTARGINVGYYPFRVLAETPQYSGDYAGPPDQVFAPGAGKGVILQFIPPGAYVGLSSTGPWYNPPKSCLDGDVCGDPGTQACTDSSPPLRPNLGGYYWGYAYSGASHMQGWIYYDPQKLQFAGHDPGHPCARGPAGVDFEVHSACGAPTACAGGNIGCGDANPCSEGADDCGRVECGAMSGGPLTPGAHKKLVDYPAGIHPCKDPGPHPSVQCLANGNDPDFFYVYPFGAYLYWGQNSTTKHWLHYGDTVQSYFHTRDAQGVLWDFVEVLASGAPQLTPASDGSGGGGGCSSQTPQQCAPCKNGGTCGWVQAVFLKDL